MLYSHLLKGIVLSHASEKEGHLLRYRVSVNSYVSYTDLKHNRD